MTTAVIRQANMDDTAAMVALLQSCAQAMSDQGMHHWLGVYDDTAVITNLQQKTVYVLELNSQIQGCIALGTQKADYYQHCWPDAPAADYYITQLAVSPAAQGKGYGKKLMQFCMEKVHPATIQLDAVDHYPALIRFYKSLGFQIIATGIGLGDKRHLLEYQAS
jgi:ribosomal protein S18 acetylase RimI-like enzyme